MATVVLLQVAATFLLTGLSWYVQLVHYPLFHFVAESEFSDFHKAHVVRTQLLIWTLLPLEIITSSITAIYGFRGLTQTQWILGWILLLTTCVSTAFLQMPLHSKLAQTKSSPLIDKLVLTHWLRTTLWTARSAMLSALIYKLLI